ncbi:MAG: DNA repair protein RadC [Colwellia sp.]|nr:DNA repair protein RadC [Colwellia sp.]
MPILREININYMFRHTSSNIIGRSLNSPELIYDVFGYLRYEPKEQFIVVNLNNQYQIMNFEVVAKGTVNQVTLRPAEVLRTAVVINAPAILIIHNHPSGEPQASIADIKFTEKIVKAGKLLSIEVLDHVIIGEDSFYSLKADGVM